MCAASLNFVLKFLIVNFRFMCMAIGSVLVWHVDLIEVHSLFAGVTNKKKRKKVTVVKLRE